MPAIDALRADKPRPTDRSVERAPDDRIVVDGHHDMSIKPKDAGVPDALIADKKAADWSHVADLKSELSIVPKPDKPASFDGGGFVVDPTTSGFAVSQALLSVSHQVGEGGTRMLVVLIGFRNSGTGVSISSVNYVVGPVTQPLLPLQTVSDPQPSSTTAIWYLPGAPSGSGKVVVQFTAPVIEAVAFAFSATASGIVIPGRAGSSCSTANGVPVTLAAGCGGLFVDLAVVPQSTTSMAPVPPQILNGMKSLTQMTAASSRAVNLAVSQWQVVPAGCAALAGACLLP